MTITQRMKKERQEYYEGTWRRRCFESVKRVHFLEPQDAMLTSCSLAACRLYNAYVRKLSCVHLGRCVVQSWYNVRSAPTTLTSRPTTLQGHIYDPQTRMPGAHLRPSQLNLRPFKITHTTLKPACQERTYDPHSSTYDPSRPHLRPSNLHVRSAPTTLTAQPTTLQGHTYDPPTRMSGSHDDPLRTLAEYKGISQSA